MLTKIPSVRKNKCIGLIFIIILVLLDASTLYAELPLLHIFKNSWDEYYDEPCPVSAYIYMGAIIGNGEKKIDPDLLLVHLPTTNKSKICVEILSRDARYYARSTYDISGCDSGLYRLEIPTSIPETLKNYFATEISVLAELKNNCDHFETTTFIPVSWGLPRGLSHITVQLNASGAESKLIIPKDSGHDEQKNVKCRVAESRVKNTTFDTLCTFDIKDLKALCRTILRRREFGDWLEPEQLRIFCSD